MAEKDQISAFSREIIDFQRKNHLTDTEMALNSHVSVEHIHNIKSMREMPDSSVVATLKDYMEHKPSGKYGAPRRMTNCVLNATHHPDEVSK